MSSGRSRQGILFIGLLILLILQVQHLANAVFGSLQLDPAFLLSSWILVSILFLASLWGQIGCDGVS